MSQTDQIWYLLYAPTSWIAKQVASLFQIWKIGRSPCFLFTQVVMYDRTTELTVKNQSNDCRAVEQSSLTYYYGASQLFNLFSNEWQSQQKYTNNLQSCLASALYSVMSALLIKRSMWRDCDDDAPEGADVALGFYVMKKLSSSSFGTFFLLLYRYTHSRQIHTYRVIFAK